MSWHFRKRIKILPGVHVNLSKSGVSYSIGPRGYKLNISKRGAYVSQSIPGTGLYSRNKIASSRRNRGTHYTASTTGQVKETPLFGVILFGIFTFVSCIIYQLGGSSFFLILGILSAIVFLCLLSYVLIKNYNAQKLERDEIRDLEQTANSEQFDLVVNKINDIVNYVRAVCKYEKVNDIIAKHHITSMINAHPTKILYSLVVSDIISLFYTANLSKTKHREYLLLTSFVMRTDKEIGNDIWDKEALLSSNKYTKTIQEQMANYVKIREPWRNEPDTYNGISVKLLSESGISKGHIVRLNQLLYESLMLIIQNTSIPSYLREIIDTRIGTRNISKNYIDPNISPYLEAVAELMIYEQVTSISHFMEVFGLSYEQGCQVYDQLESIGILSPANGGPRTVIKTSDVFEKRRRTGLNNFLK